MSLVPSKATEKVAFFESRESDWSSNAVAIGTTAGAVTSLTTKVTTAKAKLLGVVTAKANLKTAVAEAQSAVRDMGQAGADIIRQIRTKAAIDGDGVYVLADIPAPATPSPVAPAGHADRLQGRAQRRRVAQAVVEVPEPFGVVGTTYQIARKTGAVGAFVPLTTVGTRSFTDTTVPAGTAQRDLQDHRRPLDRRRRVERVRRQLRHRRVGRDVRQRPERAEAGGVAQDEDMKHET
jgi:hypothetical protein